MGMVFCMAQGHAQNHQTPQKQNALDRFMQSVEKDFDDFRQANDEEFDRFRQQLKRRSLSPYQRKNQSRPW